MNTIAVDTMNKNAIVEFPSAQNTVYSVKRVGKSYSGIAVLSDINLDFLSGEIHGIIGKNGAGKTTLVDIMHGSNIPSQGELIVFGEKLSKLTPSKAHEKRIVLVPQKTNYADDLSIAESLYIGGYPKKFLGFVNNRDIEKLSKQILKKIDFEINPKTKMGDLPLEKRRLIEVAKALWCFNAKVLILDETTAALGFKFRGKLFKLLRKVAIEEGRTIIFISHRLDEMMEICDRISTLRDGALIRTATTKDIDITQLAELITGGCDNGNGKSKSEKNNIIDTAKTNGFRVSRLSYPGSFSDVSFKVGIGEVVGLAGMVGSGYSDLLRYLGGILPNQGSGKFFLGDNEISPHSPAYMIKNGLGYLTNKREEEALFHDLSIADNFIGSNFKKYINKLGLIKHENIDKNIRLTQKNLDIKMPSPKVTIENLSGGNKQKIIVGRLLDYGLKVILFDEVAEGVDIGARRTLLDFIRNNVRKDTAVLMASNVVMDLMDVCDRIMIIFQGSIIKTFDRSNFDEHQIYSSLQGIGINEEAKNLNTSGIGRR